jgi:Rv2175c C-terminal domain of unknown function/Helix-turn-helix domain
VAARSLGELLPAEELADLAVDTELAVGPEGRESAGASVLTGEALPTRADVAAAHLRNVRRAFVQRRQLLADSLTVREVSELLGIGRQSLHDRLRAASLLAVKDRGQWRFPLWQFDPDGPDGILDGLPETLRSLRGPVSDLGKVRWFLSPKDALEGQTPLDALRAGQADAVIRAAQALGAS